MRLACFGEYDENTSRYHEEHCIACSQVRACLYKIKIQNIIVGGRFIRPKPEEAPDCFAYYYDRSRRSNEPDCEDLCRSFTDCIKATLRAIKFSQESARVFKIRRMGVVNEPEQKKPRPEKPDKATSRFEVIELDGGEVNNATCLLR